jgi:thiol-disulfide isomerase/thioredoxin
MSEILIDLDLKSDVQPDASYYEYGGQVVFREEFKKNPELKREYLSQYFNSFPRSKRNQIAEPELLKLEQEENLSQNDYETLTNGFKTNRDFVKAEKYYKIIKKNYPESRLVSARYYTKFRNMITAERMIEVFNEFNKLNSENNLNNYMVSTIIRKHAIDNNYEKVQEMLDNYSNYTKSNIYNTLAWNIFEADGDMSKASQFCNEGIKLAREHLKNPNEDKPVYMDKEDWENSRKYSLAMILDTHGSIQNKLGNKAEALTLFEEAVHLTDRSQTDINENYIKLLFDMEKYEIAKNVIEEEISEGKATQSMRSLLADIFSKEGGSDDKFDEYIEKFDNAAKEKLQAKLKHEMKNEPAPDFELLNMDGKTVKLSDYKGKTVVLDFWATWCGPCLQSFPVMKKAVEKYADNPDVEFLFVNTLERVPEKKKNAEEFLQRTKYPFHVLLDDQNEVVEKFKVQGIPTKFIIDGNSNIRFQSVGFSGVESEVLEELDQMIAMTQ